MGRAWLIIGLFGKLRCGDWGGSFLVLNYVVLEDVMILKMNVGFEVVGDYGNCVFYVNIVVDLIVWKNW